VSRTRWRVVLSISGLCLTGCVFPDQVQKIQQSVTELQQQLTRVRADQAASSQKLAAIEEKLGSGEQVRREEFADLKVGVDEMSRRVHALDERIQDANRRLDRMSQDVLTNRELSRRMTPPAPSAPPPADAPPTAGTTPPGSGQAVPSAESLYNAAYADFSKGNYALAISGFEEYASRFPESDLADNALYWIGECHFSQGEFPAAVQSLDAMLEKYPQSDRAPAANLKKGLALLEDNKIGQAIVQLRYVIATYSTSDEARVARDKLQSMGKPAS
jgi:tol-pal system protein YbgF